MEQRTQTNDVSGIPGSAAINLAPWGGETPLSSPSLGDGPSGHCRAESDSVRRQRGGSAAQLKAARQRQEELRVSCLSNLKREWLDEPYWRQLAKNRKYRMPMYFLPLTKKGIERVLKELGQSREFFREAFGLATYCEFVVRNPRMPLWVFAGNCLEILDSNRR